MPAKDEYIAIKLRGLNFFLWFEKAKVTEDVTTFTGKEGWGKGGAFTSITCDPMQIVARLESDTLQYS